MHLRVRVRVRVRIRRGWVQIMLHLSEPLSAASSMMNCGTWVRVRVSVRGRVRGRVSTWVVFPQPVSPETRTT